MQFGVAPATGGRAQRRSLAGTLQHSCQRSADRALRWLQADVRQHATWLAQRPDSFEVDALEALLGALRRDGTQAASGFRLHIAHVSSAQLLPLLKAAKAEGALQQFSSPDT